MFGQVLSSIASVLQSKKYAGVRCVSVFSLMLHIKVWHSALGCDSSSFREIRYGVPAE